MKYVLALAACFGILVLYAVIAGFLGWKHGGGVIPTLILVVALVGTWRAVTKKGEGSDS